MEDQPKRKMKTPSQLEILERVYAEDKYPSEIVRSELSAKLNLTDRQVKMWFCHRRLKDRKVNNDDTSTTPGGSKKPRLHHLEQQLLPPPHPGLSLDLTPPPPPTFLHQHQPPQQAMRLVPLATAPPPHHPHNFLDMMHPEERAFQMRQLARRELESGAGNGSAYARLGLHNVSSLVNAELAAIRLVEEQLGEPLRDDGPMLGFDFDPLPPGAFDTPIEHGSQWRNQTKLHTRHDAKTSRAVGGPADFSPSPATSSSKRKTSPFLANIPVAAVPHSPRVPHEHQFIPEHPTGAHWNPKPLAVTPPLSPFIPPAGAEATPSFGAANGFCTDNRAAPTLGLGFSPGDFLQRRDAIPPPLIPPEVQLLPPVRPPMSEKAIAGSERLIMLHEQEQARMERKRKAEEARMAKELEAQEKRMRKEAERQEALRRKKEEQERKEMERINREKQKELERLMRERAREEERIQRQHRKEFERMEKMMQKEHQRVERLRQKEEMRREKEATKLRAAYERATAKKLAKLSTGLIDDEQLELMQMGAFVQGLASTSSFDLSNVELPKFPPPTIRMKTPIAVSPWIDSHHNLSNLFMVWRLLTNFADVIGLWPFTLDEFVQALHDYDSRLLGEIHIALLKTLVKDVKDASQASGVGSTQASSMSGGSHPELVEAAYAWGFDIQEWGQHLNPLTWPEILRQFALASGYGPRWKKKISEPSGTTTANVAEGKNAEEAVANLRSGAAAANAVTQMRGKSLSSRLRKQQQQQQRLILTPGTVKYAAFQVLSVEGSNGLTILEVVDRVQKAGLRDLSTSKTPEASISAVLSRDTKLFERVAPSTYCVRAAYRKNPEEAEAVLQAAREKIRLYESGAPDVETIEDDLDEGDEEDEAEEQEVEVLESSAAETNANNFSIEPGKVVVRFKVGKPTPSPSEAEASEHRGNIDINVGSHVDGKRNNVDINGMEIDESQFGEVWVQGLMEGEYADLSVEERLCGLVALVEAVNQGNTIRSAIEDRYEAASALKRQLWEEVQLDKRRIKEECAARAEEGQQQEEKALVLASDNGLTCGSNQQEDVPVEELTSAERKLDSQKGLHPEKSRAEMKADIRLRAERLYVIRSLPLGLDRRQNRYWQFVTSSNSEDPGCARIFFESHSDGHWEVLDTEEALNSLMNSLDTRGVREAHLFVALKELEASMRQAMAVRSKLSVSSCEGSPSSGAVVGCGGKEAEAAAGSIKVELGRTALEKKAAVERYRELERWLWNNQCSGERCSYVKAAYVPHKRETAVVTECSVCHDLHWPQEMHCSLCHLRVPDDEAYSQHIQECERKLLTKDPEFNVQGMLPSRIQLLKKLLFVVEVSIPSEAFKPVWSVSYRKAWCDMLKVASTGGEVLQAFMDLESAINEEWLSASYETIEQVGLLFGGYEKQKPPWIPHTTAAVALRLVSFDAALAYTNDQRQELLESRHKQRKIRAKQVSPPGAEETDNRQCVGAQSYDTDMEHPSKAGGGEQFYDDPQWNHGTEEEKVKEHESDDSLNWDAQDSFEEHQQIENEDGMILEEEEVEEEEEDERISVDDEEDDEVDVHSSSSDTDDTMAVPGDIVTTGS